MFGLASDPANAVSADILPFTSTHAHSRFSAHHVNIKEGISFFVVVKATDRAGITATKV